MLTIAEMTDTREHDDIPLYTIVFDRAAFAQLSRADREAFWYQARRLEELGYMARSGRAEMEWAAIDFKEYSGFDAYLAQCRKVHTGNAVRDALKAERKGYYSKFFNPQVFVGDIVDVNTSAPERQGGPMAEHYFKSVEERGGYAASREPEAAPAAPAYWMRHWGIFRPNPGHCQGPVTVDEQLLGYCILRRCSEFLMYSTFLGHWDYLGDGITYKMHLDLVELILDQQSQSERPIAEDRNLEGVRYLFYARYFTVSKGLVMWKRRMLFRPGFFAFDYPPPPTPSAPPLPLATMSSSQGWSEPDYQTSGFQDKPAADRVRLVLSDGSAEVPVGTECFNLIRAFAQPEAWESIKGALIGASLIDQNHPLLIEALTHSCRRLAPEAPVFAAKYDNAAAPPSAAGRNLGDWLLRLARETHGRADTGTNLGPQLLASLVSSTAHRALGVDRLLRQLRPDIPIADVLATGAGSGLLAYFVLASRLAAGGLNISVVDHVTELHSPVRELFESLAEQVDRPVSMKFAASSAEVEFTPGTRDLVMFDAAVWRIAERDRPALFQRAWDSLRDDGLLIINAVVRSDGETALDAHDRNFAQAPKRGSMIALMTFDHRPPLLYRAVNAWQRAEEPSAASAAGYAANSFLVAGKAANGADAPG
jgi:hypothetical protein